MYGASTRAAAEDVCPSPNQLNLRNAPPPSPRDPERPTAAWCRGWQIGVSSGAPFFVESGTDHPQPQVAAGALVECGGRKNKSLQRGGGGESKI